MDDKDYADAGLVAFKLNELLSSQGLPRVDFRWELQATDTLVDVINLLIARISKLEEKDGKG